MKIQIKKNLFVEALAYVQTLIDKRNTIPAFSHVKIETKETDSIQLQATTADMFVKIQIPCEVKDKGMITLNAKNSFDIAKILAADYVDIFSENVSTVILSSGAGKYQLVSLSPETFPELPRAQELHETVVQNKAFLDLISRTFYCMSEDETKYNLAGIYFKNMSDRLRIVATDGHRLAYANAEFSLKGVPSDGVIVPKKAIFEMRKVLQSATTTESTLKLSGSMIGVDNTTTQMMSRLIEGSFPDYTQVIPQNFQREAKINRMKFHNVLRRVSVISNDRNIVKLNFSNKLLTLSTEDQTIGSATEALEIDYKGEALTIGFNAFYLLEAIDSLKEEAIVFHLIDDLSPGILKPLENSDSMLAVVMPIRI